MKVIKVLVDKMPESCSDCTLLCSDENRDYCPVINDKKNNKVCDPYTAKYRRHDCSLIMRCVDTFTEFTE